MLRGPRRVPKGILSRHAEAVPASSVLTVFSANLHIGLVSEVPDAEAVPASSVLNFLNTNLHLGLGSKVAEGFPRESSPGIPRQFRLLAPRPFFIEIYIQDWFPNLK